MKALFALTTLVLVACTANPNFNPSANQVTNASAKAGKAIAFSREKGNCLACHEIADGEFPGNIGPSLRNLPKRLQTKQQLREQIWDATRYNPQTSMPPFGRNRILTEQEIDQLIDYLWSL